MKKRPTITILVFSLKDTDGKTKALVDIANTISRFANVTLSSVKPFEEPAFPLLNRVKTDVIIKEESLKSAQVIKTFGYTTSAGDAVLIQNYLENIRSDFFYMPNYDSAFYWLVLRSLPSRVISILGDHGARRNDSLKSIVEQRFVTNFSSDYYFGSVIKQFDAVHCINPINTNFYEKCHANVITIPNICSLKKTNKVKKIKRENRIICVGRLVAIKQHDLAIKAFQRVLEDYPDWTLHIYGEGSEQETLECLINEMGLQDTVFLEGVSNDIHSEYSRSKIYLSTSDYESFGLTYIEAMLNGIPVMSFGHHVGAKYLLVDGRGILVSPDETDQLYLTICETIRQVNSSDKRLKSQIDFNKQYAQGFSPGRIAQDWQLAFQNLNRKYRKL